MNRRNNCLKFHIRNQAGKRNTVCRNAGSNMADDSGSMILLQNLTLVQYVRYLFMIHYTGNGDVVHNI